MTDTTPEMRRQADLIRKDWDSNPRWKGDRKSVV